MKIDGIDIHALLKEENQQFWDFLALEVINPNISAAKITQMHENYIVDEIEAL